MENKNISKEDIRGKILDSLKENDGTLVSLAFEIAGFYFKDQKTNTVEWDKLQFQSESVLSQMLREEELVVSGDHSKSGNLILTVAQTMEKNHSPSMGMS